MSDCVAASTVAQPLNFTASMVTPPITLDTAALAPGESTTLTVELGMHPGMDGHHALLVHVPIHSTDGTHERTLDVVGDFRA